MKMASDDSPSYDGQAPAVDKHAAVVFPIVLSTVRAGISTQAAVLV